MLNDNAPGCRYGGPRMKKMKWILISLTGVLALGGGGGWLALRSWLQANATPDALVQRVEQEWNCRANVKKVDVTLFANPAKISVSGFGISPRDGEVGKPLAERAPTSPGPGIASVPTMHLEVDTQGLAGGRLHVKKLLLSEVWLREEITPEGTSILEETFRRPDRVAPGQTMVPVTPPTLTVDDKPVAAAEALAPEPAGGGIVPPVTAPAPIPTTVSATKPDDSGLPFGLIVDEAILEKMTFRIRNRQARTTTNFNNLNVRISAMDVDTADLAKHNECKIEVSSLIDSSGRAKVGSETKDVKFADFALAAHGMIKPYDEATREFAPHGQVTLELKKGGIFGGTQTIGQAAGKDKSFANLKDKFGIDVSDLIIGGTLQEDVSAAVNYEGGKVHFLNDVRFVFPDYVVTLRKDSWINASDDDHDMRLQLLPTEALAKRIQEGVTVKMGDGVAKLALSVFNDGQGRLAFDIASGERLSKPKFRLDGQAGVIEQLFKGLLK